MDETLKLPLWKTCLERMRQEGMAFKSSWPVEYFEGQLKCKRDTQQFTWEMLSLRGAIEEEDGYYLRSSQNGKLYDIPETFDHEEVAHGFERKLRRYAVRAVSLRAAVLMNPKAELTDAERKKMDSNLEKASIRLVLLARSTSIANEVRKNAPKLLESKK